MQLKNTYENMGEYYIGYTPKTKEKFYFDSKNFDIVNQYRWKRLSNGNIATMINNHSINMSKFYLETVNMCIKMEIVKI